MQEPTVAAEAKACFGYLEGTTELVLEYFWGLGAFAMGD